MKKIDITQYKRFTGSNSYKNHKRILIPEKRINNKIVILNSLEQLFDDLKISNGMTLSFHHHLRNGDYILNDVAKIVKKRELKGMTFAPSSIFPNNETLVSLIENQNIINIYTNYINGPVATAISNGKMAGMLIMHTHGGRARAIESGELEIDVAILAVPTVDRNGNGSGAIGKSACGSLGYAISDLKYAKKVVLVTDNLVDNLETYDLAGQYVDYIVQVEAIGDPKGIVSGTTQITKDPVALKIARNTAILLDELGILKDGLAMQTGAGGTSLAVAKYVKDVMLTKGIKGSMASGGITGYYTAMLEEGMFEKLYDVQCFDLAAVESYAKNSNHIGMSASQYANPFEEDVVVNNLDFVVLGATEIDINYNVNVLTDSYGRLIGGSGGHSDTANGASVTIITTNLAKSRLPIVKEKVTTITTPGEDIDILVTERGIAINPKRSDLLDKLKKSKLNIVSINDLMRICYHLTGIPKEIKLKDRIVGAVIYRDGTLIDYIYQTN